MKIHFERLGGLSGMHLETTIDTDTLPPDDAQLLIEGVKEADFFNLPTVIHAPNASEDLFVYKIRVDSPDQHHTVETDDQAAPVSLRTVMRKLELLARGNKNQVDPP